MKRNTPHFHSERLLGMLKPRLRAWARIGGGGGGDSTPDTPRDQRRLFLIERPFHFAQLSLMGPLRLRTANCRRMKIACMLLN